MKLVKANPAESAQRNCAAEGVVDAALVADYLGMED